MEENNSDEDVQVSQIPGEPAIVINGLPPSLSTEDNLIPCSVTNSKPQPLAGFGNWVEGREVRKVFGDQQFKGKVTQFDKEMGWFRVTYEDGDFEDLEWHELLEILVPLDINIPLETLARKIIKKKQKAVQKSAKSKARSRQTDWKGKEKKLSGALE